MFNNPQNPKRNKGSKTSAEVEALEKGRKLGDAWLNSDLDEIIERKKEIKRNKEEEKLKKGQVDQTEEQVLFIP